MRSSSSLLCGMLILVMLCAGEPRRCAAQARVSDPGVRSRGPTEWRVSPSLKFDALCFLNVLTGDPFYVPHYREDYKRFAPRLTPPARAALANLKRRIKDERGGVVSAFLCLYFSATGDDDQTPGEMLAALDDTAAMELNLRRTPYFSEDGWRLFRSLRADLKVSLSFLETIRFDDYWRQNVLPRAQRKAAEMETVLPRYDVAAEVERASGSAPPSNRVTLYLLFYAHPHGMRLTGARFAADAGWPAAVIVQNAIHEMLHPPYDLAHDAELREALSTLKRDRFLTDRIKHHERSFGYNSLESFVEEDCVRALEQLAEERLAVAREPRRRWREEDGGMHVFAAALYALMKRENYDGRAEPFRDFLVRAIRSGKLGAGSIEPAYKAFYREANP